MTDHSIKEINLETTAPKVKKKIILFRQFKDSKGAKLSVRLLMLSWDIQYAIERALYGYESIAVFDLDSTFTERYLEILKQFKEGCSYPAEMTYEEWQANIDIMIGFLKIMQENDFAYAKKLSNDSYDWEAMRQFKAKKEQAKNEFFELFSLFFFDLWD